MTKASKKKQNKINKALVLEWLQQMETGSALKQELRKYGLDKEWKSVAIAISLAWRESGHDSAVTHFLNNSQHSLDVFKKMDNPPQKAGADSRKRGQNEIGDLATPAASPADSGKRPRPTDPKREARVASAPAAAKPPALPTARVTYWNGRGRAEPIRFLLAAANIHFDEQHLSKPEHLTTVRKSGKLMYNQVPLVEIDGMNLVQSGAAARYIARKGGLYPLEARQAYLVDAVYDGVSDFRGAVLSFPFHLDTKKLLETLQAKIPRYVGKWEQLLQSTDSGFFLHTGASMADIVVFEVINFIEDALNGEKGAFEKLFGPYPKVLHLCMLAKRIGQLAMYVNKRKQLPWQQYAAAVRSTLDGLRGR